ncbi:hypothetical protein EC991_009364 [Linnemannia zychae]|nr:hypothetical protein EC991_009364 [Linnemannia zychae]
MAMDNKTVRDAIQIHGTNPQFLIEKILRTRIYESKYWKESCFGLTESSIIEKAYELNAIGGQYGVQKPTEFICLVLKLLQLQPREEIVIKYITGLTETDNNKYLRALGAFYLRLVGKPIDIYNYLEPLLDDSRKLRKRGNNGYSIIHMDEFIDELLREERVCDVVLPRLTKRYVLEDAGELDPRISTLEKLEMELEEERKAEEAAALPAIPSTLSSSFGRPSAVNTMQFFESIAESCPRLQSLQFSKAFGTEPNNRAHGIEYHWRIAALFPSATRWTFQVNDLLKMQTFNQKHLLGSEHANLTTLVIEGPLLEARHAEERLNVFLTSSTSSAHKLIHLQVTGLAFPIWWWDLELRQGHSYPLSKQKEPLRNSFFCADIWRCRSLKTLHVRVRDKDELHFGRTSMRIICGYVSKVFPELEDLVLEKTLMDFDMDSGLCLLTRLSRLKKLSVVALAYGRVVSGCLDWLAKDWPRTSRAKKQLLNEWRLLRPRYVEETFAHAPFRSAQDSKPGCSVRDYMVDGVDMRHVGQVRDIVEAVKERLSDGGMCWPWLEFLQLRIGADVQQRQESLVLEAKVREMRPEIELEVIRRRLQS